MHSARLALPRAAVLPLRLRQRCRSARRPAPRAVQLTRAEFDDSPKMYIPPDAFGGATPERTMAVQMKAFFTYVASHIVLGQLMNASPRLNTADGSSAAQTDGASESARLVSDYDQLQNYLFEHPVRDGDAWLRGLAATAPRVATRVAAVRLAYGKDEEGCGFEWDSLRRLAEEEMRDGNLAVMRNWAASLVPRSE